MAKRSMKIKRYHSVGGVRRGPRVLRRVLVVLLIAAVIFAIGWFGAARCIDFITDFWYTHISVNRPAEDDPLPEDAAVPEDSSSEPLSGEASGQEEPAPMPVTDAAGVWGEVALSAMNSEDTLRAALSALKQAGADHAVVTLKDERGYVYYDSAVEMAAEAVRAQTDLSLFVTLCGEYDLAPCARLEAFRDSLTPYAYRDAAVHFERQGVLWLDTSAELGGKPWFNPYSEQARGYILALAQELAAAGMTDIVFSGVQFPSGYALEFCYYGENAAQLSRTDCLRECVALLQTAMTEQEVNAWFEWPAAEAMEALNAAEGTLVYGNGPAVLGAQRMLLTPRAVRNAEGGLMLPGVDAAALTLLAETAVAAGTQRLALDVSGLAADPGLCQQWETAAQAAGFTHFARSMS